MSNIGDYHRDVLFHSLSAVETNTHNIIEAMTASLAAAAEEGEAPELPAEVATLLTTMLVDQAKHLIAGRKPQSLDLHRAEHELHGISGRHYSRYGDALSVILKDSLGRAYSSALGSAWGDAFWAVVRALRQNDAVHA